MPKQTVTIEVDVPEGYEATGECRPPNSGEEYLDTSIINGVRTPAICSCSHPSVYHDKIILRKKWTPAAYLPQGYWLFVWNTDDKWFICKEKPKEYGDGYARDSDTVGLALRAEDYALFHQQQFVPPVGTNRIQIDHT